MSDTELTTDLCVGDDDPCLTGHFPDRPVVPAAAILDRLAAWLSSAAGVEVTGVARARFKLALLPGVTWRVAAQPPADGRIKVTCTQEARTQDARTEDARTEDARTEDARTAMTATFLIATGEPEAGP